VPLLRPPHRAEPRARLRRRLPERAILVGDFSNPDDPVTQMRNRSDALERRTEQRTGPNVTYVGAHQGHARPGQEQGAADLPLERAARARARLAAGPHRSLPRHDARARRAPRGRLGLEGRPLPRDEGHRRRSRDARAVPEPHGIYGFAWAWLPEILAIVFTTVTTFLLVADLKRPQMFLSLLLRPNTRSWLVKGAWV
jgi:hypothetical protein